MFSEIKHTLIKECTERSIDYQKDDLDTVCSVISKSDLSRAEIREFFTVLNSLSDTQFRELLLKPEFIIWEISNYK